LVRGDSLWPFLVRVAGWPAALVALGHALVRVCFSRDRRTGVKAVLLRDLLAGRRRSDLEAAARDLKKWVRWIPSTVEALRQHHAAGHRVVIASGSLNLYLPLLLEGVPYDALLCTDIGEKDGFLTGEMAVGNCVRRRKAERVKAFMDLQGPFDATYGYGNAPHDLPMLELVQHRHLV
jgi:HAD superfamily phosphoserine phosphatase-like hydrolase